MGVVIMSQDKDICKLLDLLLGKKQLGINVFFYFLEYTRKCKIIMPCKIAIEKEY